MTGSMRARGITARMAAARCPIATAAVAAAVAVGGCATVPTSGAVHQFGGAAQAGSALPKDYAQEIPEPPGAGWDPKQIVQGFLVASASFAGDHAMARQYLDPNAPWHLGGAVTVVSGMTSATVFGPGRQYAASQSDLQAKVDVKGVQVATLTSTGQSQTPAKPRVSVSFTLDKVNGQWRITNPPAYLLLLQQDFPYVYKPQNVYFLAPSGRTLVPDPVFVPQQDTNEELATGLVDALLQDPAGWLAGAAATGFPRKSSLLGPIRINGPNATVNLGGKAATADRLQQEQMAAQLTWTLGSGPTAIQSVEIEINGRPLPIGHSPLQLLQSYARWTPEPAPLAGSSLYYVSSGTVKALSGVGPPGSGQLGSVTAVTGAAGGPRVPWLRSIAVSPDGRLIAGISRAGKTVYAWDLTHKAALRVWHSSSGTCTSLSWDRQGDLWITAGGSVWLLPPGRDSATPVSLSLPGPAVTSFQVAPDGVRAVMIVNNDQLQNDQVQLVAIVRSGGDTSLGQTVVPIGSGIGEPQALSWYDANNVIVLDGSSSGGQLWEVPLNGGAPSAIGSVGTIVSVTAASPNIAIGLATGQVMVSSNLGAFESTHATGQAPVFPG